MRAVLDLAECAAQVFRQVDADLVRHIGGGGQDDGAGLHFPVGTTLAVPDENGVLLVHDLLHGGSELDPVAQRGRDRLGQGGRAADDALAESLADAQYQAGEYPMPAPAEISFMSPAERVTVVLNSAAASSERLPMKSWNELSFSKS